MIGRSSAADRTDSNDLEKRYYHTDERNINLTESTACSWNNEKF
jgi:hypothetical protein